jgi:hypothetical protein
MVELSPNLLKPSTTSKHIYNIKLLKWLLRYYVSFLYPQFQEAKRETSSKKHQGKSDWFFFQVTSYQFTIEKFRVNKKITFRQDRRTFTVKILLSTSYNHALLSPTCLKHEQLLSPFWKCPQFGTSNYGSSTFPNGVPNK